jgi:hypothetical protein
MGHVSSEAAKNQAHGSFHQMMVPFERFSSFAIKYPAQMSSWALAPSTRDARAPIPPRARSKRSPHRTVDADTAEHQRLQVLRLATPKRRVMTMRSDELEKRLHDRR